MTPATSCQRAVVTPPTFPCFRIILAGASRRRWGAIVHPGGSAIVSGRSPHSGRGIEEACLQGAREPLHSLAVGGVGEDLLALQDAVQAGGEWADLQRTA